MLLSRVLESVSSERNSDRKDQRLLYPEQATQQGRSIALISLKRMDTTLDAEI